MKKRMSIYTEATVVNLYIHISPIFVSSTLKSFATILSANSECLWIPLSEANVRKSDNIEYLCH